MDVLAIFGLVEKGMEVISTLITLGKDAAPAISVIKNLVTGAKTGQVTPEQLSNTEALLDQLISDFNEPIE